MTDEQQKAARHPETSNWSGPRDEAEHETGGKPVTAGVVARDVEDLLAEEAKLDLADVNVSVIEGEVTLEGYVARFSDKTHAEEVVLDMDGVHTVRNNLRIAPERH